MKGPIVSVIMPVYNGEKYVRNAVQSILDQTLSDFEFIVIDDGSTDSTPQIVQAFEDDRIVYLKNQQNRGVAYSLNRAIELSRGEFIARMDSDDEAFPNRLKVQCDFLSKNLGIALCGCFAKRVGGDSSLIRFPLKNEDIHAWLMFNPPIIHPTVCWRKNAFCSENLAYSLEPTAEDYDLWVRAISKLQLANIPKVLLKYRTDFEVKLSAYVQQQIDGAKRIRRSILRPWAKALAEEDFEIHDRISEGLLPMQTSLEYKQASQWLNRMNTLNQETPIVGDRAMRRCTRHYHYTIVSSMNRSVGIRAVLKQCLDMPAIALSPILLIKFVLKRLLKN